MKQIERQKNALTPHQQKVFDGIVEKLDNVLLNVLKSTDIEEYLLSLGGPAGTGKTFLTTAIARHLQRKNHEEDADYSLVVTAPTHKAVSVLAEHFHDNGLFGVACKTIHAFLGIKPFIDYETGEERFTIDKTKKHKESASVLIVDESSMVGSELYEYILDAVEAGRVSAVLFIGDPYQLLPVNDSENPVFKLRHRFELTEVVRQARDNPIIQVATRLRKAIETKRFTPLEEFFRPYMQRPVEAIRFIHNQDEFLDDFCRDEKWYDEDKIVASYSNRNVDGYNRHIRAVYWRGRGVSNPDTLRAGDRLRFKEAYTPRDTTLFHNNEIVTLGEAERTYENHLGIHYWRCKVEGDRSQSFFIVDPGSEKTLNDKLKAMAEKAKQSKFPKRKEYWDAYHQTKNMFAKVQYVYASTIYKLQGSTYGTVYADLFSLVNAKHIGEEEKYRLAYVAITRASMEVRIFMRGSRKRTPVIDLEREEAALGQLLSRLDL